MSNLPERKLPPETVLNDLLTMCVYDAIITNEMTKGYRDR